MPATSTYRVCLSLPQRVGRVVGMPLGWLTRRAVWGLMNLMPGAVGFWIVELPFVFAAVATLSKLKVFDQLRNGPQSAAELARAVQADEDALLRLLRTLSAIGLLKRFSDGRFALRAVTRQFCSDVPVPLGILAETGLTSITPLLKDLPDAVRAGQPLMKFSRQQTCWEYLETIPGATELHDQAMNAWSALVVDKIAAGFDFSKAQTVVDVGGGRGAFLAAVLRATPQLRGTVIDREFSREIALQNFQQQGVADRAEFVAGNFFESVPPGADLYTIKHVLHDWDDDHARQIVASIRAAIPPHGRLLIVEGSVDHDLLPAASVRAIWDLSQFVCTWGKSRTLAEFSALLESTGFRLDKIHLTQTIDALILEAVPV